MSDPALGPLLAMARAKLTVGLLLLMVASALLGWGFTHEHPFQRPEAGCGVVDQAEEHPAKGTPPTAAMLRYLRGERLFKANCAACHKPDRTMTGPALKGAKERWEKSGGDLHAWVKNSLAYLKDHPDDAYAQQLFHQFNGSIMTPNALMDEEIDAILDYADNFLPRRIGGVP